MGKFKTRRADLRSGMQVRGLYGNLTSGGIYSWEDRIEARKVDLRSGGSNYNLRGIILRV